MRRLEGVSIRLLAALRPSLAGSLGAGVAQSLARLPQLHRAGYSTTGAQARYSTTESDRGISVSSVASGRQAKRTGA
jgi:hypothetical protein